MNTLRPFAIHTRQRLPRGRANAFGAALAALVAAAGVAPPAFAFDDDAIVVTLFGNDRYDSNLFRVPDGQTPFNDGRRSATTRTAGVGLVLDKQYGQQHFVVAGNYTRITYDPFSSLDTSSKTLNASWSWTLTPSVTGNVIIVRTQAPNSFSDTGVQTAPNERKVEDRRFDVDWRPGAAIHPRLSLLTDEDKSDVTTFNRQNQKSSSLQGSVVYEFRSNNTAALYFRRGRGNYTNLDVDVVNQVDARFHESETGLEVHYRSSGLSVLDGQVGLLSRTHDGYSSRNFRVPVGQLAYTYTLTGKTSLQLQAGRNAYSVQTAFSSYTVDETLTVSPVWNATSKISVRPSYAFTRRTFRGALVPVDDNLQMTLRDETLAVDWNVYRGVTLTAQATRERRASNDPTYRFRDRSAFVQAALRF